MAWLILTVVAGSIGIGWGANFRGLPRRLYERSVTFWTGAPVVGLDYRRILPFAVVRYVVAAWLLGIAVLGIVGAVLAT